VAATAQNPEPALQRAGEAIEQVASRPTRENCQETTAALSLFLQASWPAALAMATSSACCGLRSVRHPPISSRSVGGVLAVCCFLCSQGRLDLQQEGGS